MESRVPVRLIERTRHKRRRQQQQQRRRMEQQVELDDNCVLVAADPQATTHFDCSRLLDHESSSTSGQLETGGIDTCCFCCRENIYMRDTRTNHSSAASEQVRWNGELSLSIENSLFGCQICHNSQDKKPNNNNKIKLCESPEKNQEQKFKQSKFIKSHKTTTTTRIFPKIIFANGKSQSKWIILLLFFLLFLDISQLFLLKNINNITKVSAYQLTNNLIANNLPPKFITTQPGQASNSEIVVRVKEGAASIGKLIYTLKGEDPDDDPLTFGVLGSMASDLLRVENVPGNSANVYLRKELDRETTESYQVVITLTDGKLGRGNWITKSMLIIVEDVNDNYPVFGPHRTAISIREDAKVPLVIETLEATDQDEGRFGQVIYRLDELADDNNNNKQQVGSSSISSMFSIETIDGKGVISLISPLDYEQKPLYQLRVLAIDRAIEHERLTASTSILISVEDCEDKPPMFTFVPSITRIPENLPIGSPIVRVAAIDGDRGINNPIQYKLVSVDGQESGFERQLFSINSDSGQISVAHELNRELDTFVDSWSPMSIFTRSSSTGSSGKDQQTTSQPGSYVIQVRATEISRSASDSDTPTRENSVTTELTVILTDVNDETPTFNQQFYYGEIPENSTPDNLVSFISGPIVSGPTIAGLNSFPPTSTAAATTTPNSVERDPTIQAKVIDRDQGTNGTFTLHLEGDQSQLFDIWPREATNEANFMIKISSSAKLQQLDYERTKSFTFVIVAREKFNPNQHLVNQQLRSNSAQMTVYLKDSNDNYPQFESDLYRVEIPENAIRGMHICSVKATDIDSGLYGTQGIRYTEIRGEKASKFKLDPLTGAITLKTNDHGFDREQVAQHHLIVEARDSNGSGNRNTTQLLIVLTDVNDQRPKFLLDQYEAFIYENELDFQSPLQVQALDNDAPNSANSRITYTIVGGDPQQNFTIDPSTGRIQVKNSLIIQPAVTTSAAHQDSPNSDGIHQQVAQSAGLDFERIAQKRDETRQFNLTIKATDQGLPEPLSDTTHVIVLVYDKNDHAPVFSRNVYTKSIREDAKEGSQVLQVVAQDGDHSPTNSKITYRISSGASDKFVIDSESGLISVANGANLDIDRAVGGQKRTNYLLNVIAFDGSFGQNQKSSATLVNITIIDVNNKPPEFISLGAARQQPLLAPGGATVAATTLSPATAHLQQQSQQQQLMVVQVNEDAPYGLIVTRVVAVDLDSSAELRYSINYARSEGRNEDMALVEQSVIKDLFSCEPTDGTIKVAKQLDRELFDQVKLRLQVEDIAAQTPDQVAYSYLLIKITDVNDNRPTFKKTIYKAVVNENSISGTSVITVTADDRDLNKTLKYSLDGPPEMMRLIRINPRSGEVTVNDKIDREMHPMINVTVKAEDYGYPHPLTGSTHLLITVRDENDNNPMFLNSSQLSTGAGVIGSESAREFTTSLPSINLPRNHNMDTASRTNSNTTMIKIYRLPTLHHHPDPHRSETTTMAANSDGQITPSTLSGGPGYEYNPAHDYQGHKLPLLSPGSTAKIREDAPIGFQVAYVRAEDADVGNNGRVTYLIDSASSGGKFRIDRDTGIISVAGSLDREVTKQFSLIIEACDNYDLGYQTGESRRAFTQVNIQILDINDNAPSITTNLQSSIRGNAFGAAADAPSGGERASMFPTYDDIMNSPGPYQQPLYDCLFINEFQALNEPILTITATDADDPNTGNGQMDLAIINNLPLNELFGLVTIQGPAQTNSRASSSNIEERASVLSSPDYSGFGDMTVGESSQQPTTSAEELSTTTTDGGRRPRQSLQRPKRSAETTDWLLMEPAVGNFYPRSTTNNNNGAGGSSNSQQQRRPPPSPARSSPSSGLPRPFSTTGPPTTTEEPEGGVVSSATMSSVRHSSGQNLDGGEQQVHLVVNQSLKERVGNYTILVRASDRGTPSLTSVKLINVCVQDVNNHSPVFTRPPLNHTIRIMENATIGTYVSQVEATDADHGLNGELQYSLKQTNIQNNNNDWQAFKIDRLTGVITTMKQFNRQLKKYYTLRVQAQDFGRPTALSSDIDINIMIVNSGQYRPEFDNQLQTLQFTENVAPGVEWFSLYPTTNLEDDPALINSPSSATHHNNNIPAGSLSSSLTGANWLATPCYFIIDSDDQDEIFHLDKYSHKLSNQRAIDREKKANYTLLIQATNNCNKPPTPPMYTRTIEATRMASGLAATPTSGSSNPLLIDYGSSSRSVPTDQSESEPRSARVSRWAGQPTSSSRDKKSIERQQREGVSSNRSSLTNTTRTPVTPTAESLVAGETIEGAGFNQATIDAMIAADKSLLKVVIKVKDVNDNAPHFTQRVYTGGITTEADYGTIFMIVQAIDADADANGQVVYSIVKPIKKNLITSSGQLPTGGQSTVASQVNSGFSGPTSRSAFSSSSSGPTTTTRGYSRQKRAPTSQNLVISHVPQTTTSPQSTTDSSQQPTSAIFGSTSGTNRIFEPDNNGMNDIPMGEGDDLFIINPQNGEISLNFDPQKHMKGYFEFEILAKDTEGLFDTAKVFIYLLRQDQRVKFVLRLTPQELRQRINKFRSVFGNITGAIVNIDSYKYSENHDGTVDKKKTSLYLHFVNPEDNTIIEVDKVLTLIDNNIEYLDELYKEFHVLSSEAAHLPLSSSALIDPVDQIRTGLLGVASFLALILVLVIALCLNQRTRYERQLKAATVSAFGSSPLHLDPDYHGQANLPNTNLHSQDPNPIWINGYSEQDWLSGAKGRDNGHLRQVAIIGAEQNVGVGIEDGDYLSSGNSDLNSLSGVNSVSQLHYNATATATPRDSLNSSQGRVSGSGSGSTSTTNERQALCRNANNNNDRSAAQQQQQPQQQQQQQRNKVQYAAIQHQTGANHAPKEQVEVVGVLKNGKHKELQSSSSAQAMMKKRAQQLELANGNVSTHSTFGAFKEVTIYTDHNQQAPQTQFVSSQHKHQQQTNPNNSNQNNLIRTVNHNNNQNSTSNQQQQQQQTSQVNKIASQFNAKHQAQRASHHHHQQQQTNGTTINQVYIGQQLQPVQNNREQHQAQTQQQQQQQQQQRIIVHANGADVNQGIIKTTGTAQQQQHSNGKGNKTSVVGFSSNNKQHSSAVDPNGGLKLGQVSQQQQRLIVGADLHSNGLAALHKQQQQMNQTATTNTKVKTCPEVAPVNAADTFETNLSKLSILNLETTEL